MAVAVRAVDFYHDQKYVQRNRAYQNDGEQFAYGASNVKRPYQQSQGRSTCDNCLHQQNGKQERTLPEIASLGLTKEECRVTCSSSPKQHGRDEEPEQYICQTEHSCDKLGCFNQAKNTQDVTA